jgi:hypothetical protein
VLRHAGPTSTVAPLPGFVVPGLPWNLTFTFEPETPRQSGICSTGNVGLYPNAITASFLQLGDFSYTFSSGRADIFTNADLPAVGCGEGGIVQFHWLGDWLGSPGAPLIHGLLIASYFDEQACDGSLPAVPGAFPTSCGGQFLALGGLQFWYDLPIQGDWFGSSFNPQVVPEPGTWLLLSSGLVAIAARRRRRHR